jgi:hypothetical protein
MIIIHKGTKAKSFPLSDPMDECSAYEKTAVVEIAEKTIGIKFSSIGCSIVEVFSSDYGFKFVAMIPSGIDHSTPGSDRINYESCFEIFEIDFLPSDINTALC